MIASSSTALGNLAYLIGAIVLAVILGFAIWLRHRKPKSVAANMASFRKGLSVLAPDARPQAERPAGRPSPVRAERGGLSTVRTEPREPRAPRSGGRATPASGQDHTGAAEAAGWGAGGESG